MIGTDPRYKCTLFVVHGNGQRFGRYCTREDAEKAVTRLAPAYNIPTENFTVTRNSHDQG